MQALPPLPSATLAKVYLAKFHCQKSAVGSREPFPGEPSQGDLGSSPICLWMVGEGSAISPAAGSPDKRRQGNKYPPLTDLQRFVKIILKLTIP